MMKKRLFLILLPFILFACQEDKPFLFDEEPGIYFSSKNIELSYDFAFYYTDGLDDWGNPINNYYLGDALQTDTISFEVFRSGMLEEGVNSFNLKQVEIEYDEGAEKLKPFEIEFFNPYEFVEGSDKVNVTAVLHRPKSRGKFETAIGFDLEDNKSGFVNTINEFSKYVIKANDQYLRPRGWVDDSSIYGAYSEEKYAFYVTVLHMPYEDWHEFMADVFLPRLREALDDYNATHDVLKDFTF